MSSTLVRVLSVGMSLFCACLAGSAAAESLKVGYLPAIGHGKYFIAYEQGFFKQENLDVELIEFQNSADGINAVISGKLDTGSFSTPAPLLFYSKGSDVKIVGGIMGQDGSIIIKPEKANEIKTVADLRGKKVATVRLASSDAVLRAALKEAKIDWRSDLEIFELKNPPAVIESVKSGQVDAGVVWGPFDLRAEQQGLKVIVRSGDLYPGHPCCRLIVSSAQLKNPAAVERFLRALLRAERFAADHRKETIDAIAKYVKLDRDTLEKSYYSPNLDQTTDPNVKGVQKFWLSLVASNFIDGKRPLEPIFAVEPYQKAIESLARENPKDAFYQARLKQFRERNL
ncbi:MAG: ABC transporter substrate-binding protein [Zoogloeaceae bacterium]|jgi:NitT/TauT family transport system substrate-binding protein|nr:ABC transporter substrate-binding protein [Zoogloeaceae bacterium]